MFLPCIKPRAAARLRGVRGTTSLAKGDITMTDRTENRSSNRTNNCKNQSQNRTENRTDNRTENRATNEHKHPNQYTKGADDEDK